MVRLSLALLGPFDATLDGQPLQGFESAKVRALLAYLAMDAGRPHARQGLASLLWPDHSEAMARTYLRQALANLRQLLPSQAGDEPILLIERDVVKLNERSAYRIDVVMFTELLAACDQHRHRHAPSCASCQQRLSAAVALYRGDLLEDLWLDGSADFEDWATVRREGLRQRCLEALDRLAICAGWAKRYAEMRAYAERQLALDPWREEAHRQLMQALYLRGQRSAALAQYERCRATLARELGVEPSRETTGLYKRIRDAAPARTTGEARAMVLGLPVAPHAHTLPAPSTPFVGRERERAHLADLLQDPACRLITIVGPGGMGKTRLALRVAAEQHETFADGAYVVALASLYNAASIVPAIASAVGVTLRDGAEPTARLFDYLRTREMLLVLDNAEHLLDGVEVLTRVLECAPGLRLLVTSRERLSLSGEWVVELAGLDYPDGGADQDEGHVAESYSAMQLFVQSARRAYDGFVLTAADVPAVWRLCRLVEGMPLAIELAASWIRVLSCHEIAGELERNLHVLTTSLRDVPERHRSMRAVFDQSWRLLPAEEQRVLRQLAVFHSGFDRGAAVAVAGAGLPDLARLVDRSLVRWTGTRYDLHEVVRHFAHEQLARAGEAEATQERHLDVFLRIAEEVEPWLVGAEQGNWLERLEADGDNLRAALDWARAHERVEAVVRLGGALWRFWWLRSHLDESRHWLDAMCQAMRDPPAALGAGLWAQALHGAGWLSIRQRAYAQATALLEQSLDVAIQTEDTARSAAVLNDLGQSARLQGQYPQAIELFDETVTLARRCGNRRLEAMALGNTGAAWHAADDDRRAEPLLAAGLALCRLCGDIVSTAWFLTFLGRVSKAKGEHEAATTYLAEALATFQGLGDRDGLAFTLEGVAGLAARQGQPERAARLFGTAAALREAIHAPMAQCDRREYERDRRAAWDQLGREAFDMAWAEGRGMSLDQSMRDALTPQREPTSA